MNGEQQPTQPKKMFWLVVIIILIILAAVYYFYFYNMPSDDAGPEDVSAIESELQSTPIEGLDSELNDIEKEL